MGKLADLFVKLGLNSTSFNNGITAAQKKTSVFSQGIAKIGGLVAGAFAVGQIVSFGKELVELSGIAEGVRTAFERIAPAGTMEDLRNATRGTVSELELMKRTVSAKNLGLPVENLASLFEFATKRAQETGESVDFLVNSIVTGIGRKSPLILDNLGISAIQLREKLKGVGMESASVADVAKAVGDIAAESMRESGEIIDTNAVKIGRMKAAWMDMKVAFSEDQEFQEMTSSTLDFMTAFIRNIPNMTKDWKRWGDTFRTAMLGGLNLLWENDNALKSNADSQKDLNKETEEFKNLIGDVTVSPEPIVTIKSLKEEIETLKKLLEEKDITDKEGIKTLQDQIRLKQIQIKLIEGTIQKLPSEIVLIDQLATGLEKLNKQIGSLESINEALFGKDGFKEGKTDILGIIQDMPLAEEQDIQEDDKMLAAFEERKQQAQMFVDDMNAIIGDGLTDLITTFSEGIGRLIAGDIGLDEFFNAILDTIGSFLITFGQALIAYGVAELAFLSSFDPVSKIAAGAALVAIGGLISGLSASGPTGSSSASSVSVPSFGIFSVSSQGSVEQSQLSTSIKANEIILVTNREERRNAVIG